MPVDNRNFIIEDLPDDPEDGLFPDEDEDDLVEPPRQQQRPTWTPPPPPWQQSYRPVTTPTYPWSFGQSQNRTATQSGIQQRQETRIDRKKKIIFCDLVDVLIESESAVKEQAGTTYLSGSNNYKRSGIAIRGLYDVRLKTEVWSKLAAFGADYVFCITNQPEKSEEELRTWRVMTDFVMYALADYLNLPHSNCKCLTKVGFDRDSEDTKPKTGLMKKALSTIPGYRYERKDLIVIGINSGYQNQSNIDRLMAHRAKVDYLDVNDLLTTYY